MSALTIVGTVLLVAAGLLHVFIFTLESVSWSKPATWKRFGVRTQDEAQILKGMAYNQGWYNLFLAIGAIGGAVTVWLGQPVVGLSIGLFAAGSMVAAALVLVTSNPRLARAALTQGALPLAAIVVLVVALTSLPI
jgi:putative membrane protein